MSEGIPIWVCERCGEAVFPERLLCPACAGSAWREERVRRGVLEEATVSRGGQSLGSVRTARGPVVVVRLAGEPAPGTEVVLRLDDGVPVAQPYRVGSSTGTSTSRR